MTGIMLEVPQLQHIPVCFKLGADPKLADDPDSLMDTDIYLEIAEQLEVEGRWVEPNDVSWTRLITLQGQVIGFVRVNRYDSHPTKITVDKLYINPGYRRRGYGSQALIWINEAFPHATELGGCALIKALPFWVKHGAQEIFEIPHKGQATFILPLR